MSDTPSEFSEFSGGRANDALSDSGAANRSFARDAFHTAHFLGNGPDTPQPANDPNAAGNARRVMDYNDMQTILNRNPQFRAGLGAEEKITFWEKLGRPYRSLAITSDGKIDPGAIAGYSVIAIVAALIYMAAEGLKRLKTPKPQPSRLISSDRPPHSTSRNYKRPPVGKPPYTAFRRRMPRDYGPITPATPPSIDPVDQPPYTIFRKPMPSDRYGPITPAKLPNRPAPLLLTGPASKTNG